MGLSIVQNMGTARRYEKAQCSAWPHLARERAKLGIIREWLIRLSRGRFDQCASGQKFEFYDRTKAQGSAPSAQLPRSAPSPSGPTVGTKDENAQAGANLCGGRGHAGKIAVPVAPVPLIAMKIRAQKKKIACVRVRARRRNQTEKPVDVVRPKLYGKTGPHSQHIV